MVLENYSIALPLNHSNCLKVTIQVLEKRAGKALDSSLLKTLTSDDPTEKTEIGLAGLQELPDNIIQALKIAPGVFNERTPMQQSFLASIASGFQLLRLNQIVCFEYLTEKKLWTVWLSDQTQLSLKRNTVAENILGYSPDFIRINQQQIINLNYLVCIEDRSCRLSAHSETKNRLIISRSYLKGLQERLGVI